MSEEPAMTYHETRVSDGEWSAYFAKPDHTRPLHDFDLFIATDMVSTRLSLNPRRARALMWLVRQMLEAANEPTDISTDQDRYVAHLAEQRSRRRDE